MIDRAKRTIEFLGSLEPPFRKSKSIEVWIKPDRMRIGFVRTNPQHSQKVWIKPDRLSNATIRSLRRSIDLRSFSLIQRSDLWIVKTRTLSS